MDKKIKVLVVEDILSARETVIHLLRALGFSQFCEAENGEDALECLKMNPSIGLILSDWNMPRLNGLGLLRSVRDCESLKNIPFVFLTSKSEIEDVALASDHGVSGYLVKPVTIRALSEALTKVFERSFEEEFEILRVEIDTLCDSGDFYRAKEIVLNFQEKHSAHAPRILYELSRIYMRFQDYIGADEIVNSLLQTQPLFAKGWEMKAKVLSWQGEWEFAIKSIEKAITISPNNADYYILKGSICLHKGDFYEAKKSFMTSLNIDKKNNQIKQDIWNAYIDLDLIDEVQQEFGSYIFSFLNCDTLNNMAVAYRRKGELSRAIEIYKTALLKEPDNPKILFNASVAYMNRKQYVKAMDLLNHAIGNDPDFDKAKSLLLQINNFMKKDNDGNGMNKG